MTHVCTTQQHCCTPHSNIAVHTNKSCIICAGEGCVCNGEREGVHVCCTRVVRVVRVVYIHSAYMYV